MVTMELTRGGRAEVVAIEGDRLEVASDIASAPGSRLQGALENGQTLRLKVHRCVRNGERFDIEGRCIDLTRGLREWLIQRVSTDG